VRSLPAALAVKPHAYSSRSRRERSHFASFGSPLIASGCRRVVFIKDGREADGPAIPMQEAPRIKRASIEQEEHVAAPGFLSRMMTRIRVH
jgi:hypothetical protein